MQNKKLVFLGFEANIKRIYDIAVASGFDVVGIVDEVHYNKHLNKTMSGLPIIGHPSTFFNDLTLKEKYVFFLSCSFKEPEAVKTEAVLSWDRGAYINKINQLDLTCVNLIAPTAQISDTAILGKGVYVGGGCVIANFVQLANFCQIHDNTLLSNHCSIGSNTIVQRRVTFVGHTVIGNNCSIGLNTQFANNYITVGNNAIIHSGFIIARNIEAGEVIHLAGRSLKKIYNIDRVID